MASSCTRLLLLARSSANLHSQSLLIFLFSKGNISLPCKQRWSPQTFTKAEVLRIDCPIVCNIMDKPNKAALKVGYKVSKVEDNTQELFTKQGHPSKYKLITPTSVEDMEKFTKGDFSRPSKRDLDHLDEGDFIKICFINKEDIWLVVERVDPEWNSLIYAKVAQQVTLANDLQKNQRVAVRREHVIEVKFANDDED